MLKFTLLAPQVRTTDTKIRINGSQLWIFSAGLISREAARVTESFVFTVGVGDDFVMRLGVDSVENLRTGIIQTLHATRLPKVT